MIKEGYIQTYDWTKNDRAQTVECLREIGIQEKAAVLAADFIIVLLPAGKGSHIEFGLALALDKKIYLHSPDDDLHHAETTSTFYHLENVEKCIGSIDQLVETVTKNNLIVS